MLIEHPLVIIVERKDTFVPIARSWIVYQRSSNGERIFLRPRRLKFGFEGLRSLLTLCWKLKLHKCGWLIIKSPDHGGQAPTPSAASMIHSGGVDIQGEQMHPEWRKLLDIFLSIIDRKGEKGVRLKGENKKFRRSQTHQKKSETMQISCMCWLFFFFYFKFNVFWVLFRVDQIVLS